MYTFLNSQNSFLVIILRLQDLNTVENEWHVSFDFSSVLSANARLNPHI